MAMKQPPLLLPQQGQQRGPPADGVGGTTIFRPPWGPAPAAQPLSGPPEGLRRRHNHRQAPWQAALTAHPLWQVCINLQRQQTRGLLTACQGRHAQHGSIQRSFKLRGTVRCHQARLTARLGRLNHPACRMLHQRLSHVVGSSQNDDATSSTLTFTCCGPTRPDDLFSIAAGTSKAHGPTSITPEQQ
eukprot:364414-Chlamydomonas_euryale.AAC.4